MPDITMCYGVDCPKKEKCHRFTAVPSEYRQSFFINAPYNHETNKCDYFYPNQEAKKVQKKARPKRA